MEIATTLLQYGAETNILTKQGVTPLHLASQEGHSDMTALLLEKGAHVNVATKVTWYKYSTVQYILKIASSKVGHRYFYLGFVENCSYLISSCSAIALHYSFIASKPSINIS